MKFIDKTAIITGGGTGIDVKQQTLFLIK